MTREDQRRNGVTPGHGTWIPPGGIIGDVSVGIDPSSV